MSINSRMGKQAVTQLYNGTLYNMRINKAQPFTIARINHTSNVELSKPDMLPNSLPLWPNKANWFMGLEVKTLVSRSFFWMKPENFWGPINDLFLHVKVDHSVFICQNSLNCTFIISALFYMHVIYISITFFKKRKIINLIHHTNRVMEKIKYAHCCRKKVCEVQPSLMKTFSANRIKENFINLIGNIIRIFQQTLHFIVKYWKLSLETRTKTRISAITNSLWRSAESPNIMQ